MDEEPRGPEAEDPGGPPAVELPQVEETPRVARSTESRTLQSLLVLATTLLFTLVVAGAAVVLAAGPELFAEEDGGELAFRAAPKCGSMLSEMRQGGCFARANVTIRYASGAGDRVTLREEVFSWSGRIELKEARATVRFETDRGTWVREVWVPETTHRQVSIGPEDPQEVQGVVGRETGIAVFAGMAALFGFILIVSTIVWWARGGIAAAYAVRGLLTLWLVVQGLIAVWALFVSALGIGVVALAAWLWFLRKLTNDWIKRGETAGAMSQDPDVDRVA